MKKLLLLPLLLLTVMLTSQAQVAVGVKGGININTVKYRDADPNSASIGFNAGAIFMINLGDDLILQPEIQLSQKGYRSPVIGANGQVSSRMNYISVPVLLTIPVGTKFHLSAGPEFGYLVKASAVRGGNKDDVTDRFQHFDWGLDAGGGYWINNNLAIDLRYNYGFRGLVKGLFTDQNGNIVGSGRDGAHRVFQAGLIYLINSPNKTGVPGTPRF